MSKLSLLILLVISSVVFVTAQDDYNKFEVSGGFSSLRAKTPTILEVDNTGNSATSDVGQKRQFNGFDASATYNFNRYWGVKFDVSGHFASYDVILPGTFLMRTSGTGIPFIVVPGSDTSAEHSFYNFLGGIQFKDNTKEGKFKPFSHALFGAARQSINYGEASSIFAGTYNTNPKQTAFAAAFGGGLDTRVGRRVDIRVIQADYNPVFQKEQMLIPLAAQITNPSSGNIGTYSPTISNYIPKQTQHNFRIGFGIVPHYVSSKQRGEFFNFRKF